MQSELALARTRSQTLRDMLQFVSSAASSADGGTLLAQIEDAPLLRNSDKFGLLGGRNFKALASC